MYTTVTTYPVTETLGSGKATSTTVISKISTVVVTSTKTICTKCVAPPETGSPSSNAPTHGAVTPPYATGPSATTGPVIFPPSSAPTGTVAKSPVENGESTVVIYTQGFGSSTTVITTTIRNTRQVTEYEVRQISARLPLKY